MSKAVRNILAVIIILFTFFCCFICLGAYYVVGDGAYYNMVYDTNLEIKDITVEKIGKTYNNKSSQEGKTYYSVNILLDNDSNVWAEKYSSEYSIESDNGMLAANAYYDGLFQYADNYLIPAGSEGKIKFVAEISDEAKSIDIYSWKNEDDRYTVKLE